MEKKSTGKKVAFFAVSSDGTITVRKPNDYVSAMIGLAGGTYSLGNYTDEEKNALSTMKMQMEDFYSAEIDADVLIYNGTAAFPVWLHRCFLIPAILYIWCHHMTR